jgi:hypothetical protein
VSDCGDDRGRATFEANEPVAGRDGARGRRALLAACAAFLAVVALGLPGSGCLNPRPEELPSADFGLPGMAPPERETCDDNPSLGGCELPSEDINGDVVSEEGRPLDDAPVDPGDSPSQDPEPSASGNPAEGAAGAGGGDAGTDIEADAGAP